MRDLKKKHTFVSPDPLDLGPAITFPVKVESINSNDTIEGYFDLDKMSAVKRVLALTL